MNESIEDLIDTMRLIPVVRINAIEDVMPLAEALAAGGLPIAEVTLRTDCALDAIEKISESGNIAVGAGTVLNVQQAKLAFEAGASFIVSPGLDEGVVRFCRANHVPVYPGVSSATEIQHAYNLGIRIAKFFPAEAIGGVKTLRALSAPFHEMRFVSTGGINKQNMMDYLELSCTIAVGGSWMVNPDLYKGGSFAEVTRLAAEAAQLARKR